MIKTLDELDSKSREFYERARFKLALSLILAAIGMMLLGFCSSSGAEAQVSNILAAKTEIPQFYRDMMKNEGGGYGFACFAYLAGFFVAFGMALYISPLLGSENEKRMLSTPSNLSTETAPADGEPTIQVEPEATA